MPISDVIEEQAKSAHTVAISRILARRPQNCSQIVVGLHASSYGAWRDAGVAATLDPSIGSLLSKQVLHDELWQ